MSMNSQLRRNTDEDYLDEINGRINTAMDFADLHGDQMLSGVAADAHHLLKAVRELKADLAAPPRPEMHQDCPACGSTEVKMRYCDACRTRVGFSNTPDLDRCAHGDPEHFHRRCQRCEYAWRTDDINDAQIRCDVEINRRKATT